MKAPFVHGTQRELCEGGKVAHDFQVLNGPGLTHNNLNDDCPRGCGVYGVLRISDGNDAWGDVTLILSIRASLRKKGRESRARSEICPGPENNGNPQDGWLGLPLSRSRSELPGLNRRCCCRSKRRNVAHDSASYDRASVIE